MRVLLREKEHELVLVAIKMLKKKLSQVSTAGQT
jgi:hypothetical protein